MNGLYKLVPVLGYCHLGISIFVLGDIIFRCCYSFDKSASSILVNVFEIIAIVFSIELWIHTQVYLFSSYNDCAEGNRKLKLGWKKMYWWSFVYVFLGYTGIIVSVILLILAWITMEQSRDLTS